MSTKYPCPVCGNLTLGFSTHDGAEICSVCFWQDDEIGFNYPDEATGPNPISLNEAKENYKQTGASSPGVIQYVRPPTPEEVPSSNPDSSFDLKDFFMSYFHQDAIGGEFIIAQVKQDYNVEDRQKLSRSVKDFLEKNPTNEEVIKVFKELRIDIHPNESYNMTLREWLEEFSDRIIES